MNRLVPPTVLVFALSCTPDVGLQEARNTPPVLSVWSPVSGQRVQAGTDLLLSGRVQDAETADAGLFMSWTSDLQGTLATAIPVQEGTFETRLPGGLSVGEHTLMVSVDDEHGGTATQTLLVEALPNAAPVLEILDPDSETTLRGPLQLVATVRDDFDTAEQLLLVVSAEEDGPLTAEAEYFGNTVMLNIIEEISNVDQQLTLQAFDRGGLHGEDTILLMGDRNEPPTIDVLIPADGTEFPETSHVWVELQIFDDTDDLTELELSWTGLPEADLCAHCRWPTQPESDGTFGFYLDLSACQDQNVRNWFTLGLQVTDRHGAVDAVEHQLALECEL